MHGGRIVRDRVQGAGSYLIRRCFAFAGNIFIGATLAPDLIGFVDIPNVFSEHVGSPLGYQTRPPELPNRFPGEPNLSYVQLTTPSLNQPSIIPPIMPAARSMAPGGPRRSRTSASRLASPPALPPNPGGGPPLARHVPARNRPESALEPRFPAIQIHHCEERSPHQAPCDPCGGRRDTVDHHHGGTPISAASTVAVPLETMARVRGAQSVVRYHFQSLIWFTSGREARCAPICDRPIPAARSRTNCLHLPFSPLFSRAADSIK